MSSNYTCIELCAGAGGQALGLESAGFEHLAALEIDPHCCKTLRLNRPSWRVVEADLRTFAGELGRFGSPDLLAAGLPCPPFSIAGKQLGRNDDRDLFPAFLQALQVLTPATFLVENVRGLMTAALGEYRAELHQRFSDVGYVTHWRVLNASDFGVSQLRPRLAIVGVRNDISSEFEWPEPTGLSPPTVGELLYDLMKANGWPGAEAWRDNACAIAPTIVGGSKKHGGPDLGPTRAKRAWLELGVSGMKIADAPPLPDFEGCPNLTVRMVARIQGFPDSWQFYGRKTHAYRQVGNAFPPPVARGIGEAIIALLDSAHAKEALAG